MTLAGTTLNADRFRERRQIPDAGSTSDRISARSYWSRPFAAAIEGSRPDPFRTQREFRLTMTEEPSADFFRGADVKPAMVLAFAAMLRFAGSRRLRRFASLSLGRLARRFSRAKRESAEEAIRGAFGSSVGIDEMEPILLGSMTGVWTELFALAGAKSARADFEPSEIIGLERLQSSLALGRGAILWESNGFGRRWIWKRILKEQGYPVVQVHGPLNLGGLSLAGPNLSRFGASWLRPLVYRWEGYFVGGVIQLAGESSLEPLKQMRRRLRDNQIVCVSADGELGDRRLDVDLLGRKASLATGLTTLARNSKAPIHPVFCIPQAEGGCKILIEDSIDPGLTGDRAIDAERALSQFAARLDSQVRARPSLYRNWHQIARHPRIP